MMRIGVRFFGMSAALRAVAPQKVVPSIAAKQFIPQDAARSKIRSLKRRENRLKRQIIRDVNNLKKHNLENVKFQVDPVLGDDSNSFVKRIREQIDDQNNLAYGYLREEFEKLLYGAEKAGLDKGVMGNPVLYDSLKATAERKRRALLTILHVKNTNVADKKKMAVKLAREEFQRQEGDTGSAEVQTAVLTARIHFGMDHVRTFPKDKAHLQRVREMVQQRQKMLKYLKADDPERYYYAIAKLGLTDDVVTREFNMDRKYLQEYKVWGDKQLVKLSDKQKRKEQQFTELQKRVVGYNQLTKKNFEQISGMKK